MANDPATGFALPWRSSAFGAQEWARIAALYGFVSLQHLLGWGLYLHYVGSYPPLAGLGFVAYMFGLRHAFDADHIAAVDDTVRYMLQKGKKPLGGGFFFSLGHSTVVIALAVGIAFAAIAVKQQLPPVTPQTLATFGILQHPFDKPSRQP